MRYRPAVVALLLLFAPATVHAQTYAIEGADRHFRLEWEPSTGRRGPVIAGYVYNTSGTTVERVRLAVESLDGAGQPTAMRIAYVVGTVPAGNRAYFETSVTGGHSYRVRVLSYEPVGRGGQ